MAIYKQKHIRLTWNNHFTHLFRDQSMQTVNEDTFLPESQNLLELSMSCGENEYASSG